jgi:hypothetical protein
MTDIFAYPGEVNPNDVKASDPTVLRRLKVIITRLRMMMGLGK